MELDDLSLKYLKPDVYYDLVEKVALRKSAREEFVNSIVKQVKQHMEDANIRAQVDGRVKHFFSIYKKMVNQDKTIDQIYDLFAVRIIVDTVKDCYAALGVIHEMYKPIPGRFKDYIAMPKANMYQSLHTTLIGLTDSLSKSRSVHLKCIKPQNTVLQLIGNIRKLPMVRNLERVRKRS